MPTSGVYHVEREPVFSNTYDRELPPVIRTWEQDAAFITPSYLVPTENTVDRSHLHLRAERRTQGAEGVAAFAIQQYAENSGHAGLTIDREEMLSQLEAMENPKDLVVAFGLYTSLLSYDPTMGDVQRVTPGKVVHQEVVADLNAIFTKAYELSENMSSDKYGEFLQDLCDNFTTMNMGVGRSRFNPSIYVSRNAFYDIVGNPQSVVAPGTVMATNLLRYMATSESPGLKRSIESTLKAFINDPRALVRNPELLFLYEELQASTGSSMSSHEADFFVGGLLNGFFYRLDSTTESGSFENNVARAYIQLANSSLETQTVRKVSEASNLFVPSAIINLAKALSRSASGNQQRLSPDQTDDFIRCTEYVLNELQAQGALSNMWPGTEPETQAAFCRALVQVAKLAN